MLVQNCLFSYFLSFKKLFAIYLRHGSNYINVIFFNIISNIGDTFYSKILKYKIKYKYNIYIYKYDYIYKYIIKYKHKLNIHTDQNLVLSLKEN